MNKINRGTGAGGANTNVNGINFEEKVYLHDWILKYGYKLVSNKKTKARSELYKIYKDDIFIGWYGRQGQIYNALKEKFPLQMTNEHIKKVLSKKIHPDAFILNEKGSLTIFEKKWQQGEGSVDEKIQTAPFKLEMFNKLLKFVKINISYQYILSEWFTKECYRNIKEYYEDNPNIGVWTSGENLNELDIEQFL